MGFITALPSRASGRVRSDCVCRVLGAARPCGKSSQISCVIVTARRRAQLALDGTRGQAAAGTQERRPPHSSPSSPQAGTPGSSTLTPALVLLTGSAAALGLCLCSTPHGPPSWLARTLVTAAPSRIQPPICSCLPHIHCWSLERGLGCSRLLGTAGRKVLGLGCRGQPSTSANKPC